MVMVLVALEELSMTLVALAACRSGNGVGNSIDHVWRAGDGISDSVGNRIGSFGGADESFGGM